MAAYKLWQEFLAHFPKNSKYTLGEKIDVLFIEILEVIFIASYLGRDKKSPYIEKARTKLDSLKFFLQIAWEVKALPNKHYIALSRPLEEIGKMLGGWLKQLNRENLPA
ncbi:MAG: four helix bundle protein [Candidatus Liptonbacteria bacterium]|nr:four helix bundle protein [Candidatus Liptonbacteria bacterium]